MLYSEDKKPVILAIIACLNENKFIQLINQSVSRKILVSRNFF